MENAEYGCPLTTTHSLLMHLGAATSTTWRHPPDVWSQGSLQIYFVSTDKGNVHALSLFHIYSRQWRSTLYLALAVCATCFNSKTYCMFPTDVTSKDYYIQHLVFTHRSFGHCLLYGRNSLVNLMSCWPCIIVYRYSETNIMHFSFSLLRINPYRTVLNPICN
jgi:hypothetical protein